MKKKAFIITISILLICFLLLIVFVKQTKFRIVSSTFPYTEIDEENKSVIDGYYGYWSVIEGPINPKINNIKIIKKDGTIVNETERLLVFLTKGKKERIGSMSTEEVNKRLDEFILPKDFLAYDKEIILAIRFNSGLSVSQIGGLKINYSFLGIKSEKYLTLNGE